MDAASLILNLVGLYLLIGIIFALVFAFAGIQRIDEAAKGAPVVFRLMLLPAATVLWPLMGVKWATQKREAR